MKLVRSKTLQHGAGNRLVGPAYMNTAFVIQSGIRSYNRKNALEVGPLNRSAN